MNNLYKFFNGIIIFGRHLNYRNSKEFYKQLKLPSRVTIRRRGKDYVRDIVAQYKGVNFMVLLPDGSIFLHRNGLSDRIFMNSINAMFRIFGVKEWGGGFLKFEIRKIGEVFPDSCWPKGFIQSSLGMVYFCQYDTHGTYLALAQMKDGMKIEIDQRPQEKVPFAEQVVRVKTHVAEEIAGERW